MADAELKAIPVAAVDDHPRNPRVVFRDDVIDAIAVNLEADDYHQEHAILVRPVADRYELIAGHHRIRAARKAAYDTVWAWVRDMPDDDAYMALATDNNQGELSPLEIGVHALGLEKGQAGRGKVGGLAEYASQIGQKPSNVTIYRQAAEVYIAVKSLCQHNDLRDKAQHLGAIHKVDESLWQMLVDAMLEKKWSAADTHHWLGKVAEFDIAGREANAA